jgi:arsenate reductase-like glutaredoxin family protein
MSCNKAREFFAQNSFEPKEIQNASKDKLGADESLALAHEASTVVVARGKKVLTFKMKKDAPDDEELLKLMLGRSGTLRAPTLRRGKTLLVGFNADAYDTTLG